MEKFCFAAKLDSRPLKFKSAGLVIVCENVSIVNEASVLHPVPVQIVKLIITKLAVRLQI